MNWRPCRASASARLGIHSFLLALSCLALACEDPNSLDRVRQLQQRGRFEASLEPLRSLLEAAPDDPELNYRYGAGLRRTGSPDRAIWALRKAADSETWSRRARLELGAAALATREWTNAIETADRLLEEDPDDVGALRIRAEARLSARNDYEAALADFDAILEQAPDDLDVRSSRAATLIALGRIDEAGLALEDMERAAEESKAPDATRSRICVTRALFADEQDELEEAEAAFRRCLEAFPKSWTVVEQFVEFLDGQRRPEEGNALLLESLERDPRQVGLRVRISERFASLDMHEEAEAVLREGLALDDPTLASALWAGLTDLYSERGDFEAASRAYEKSFAAMEAPTAMERFLLADILAQAERDERALEVSRTIDNEVYRGLVEARVAMNRHEPERALELLDEVLPRWPNNPGARYWAARAAEQLGDFDRAIEEYRQAIRSSPGFSEAGLRLARLHAAEGAAADAWTSLFRYVDERPDDREAAALLTRIASRSREATSTQTILRRYRRTKLWPVVVRERARIVAEQVGPARAITMLEGETGVDLTRAEHAIVLEEYVLQLLAAGRADDAASAVARAIEKAPEDGELQRIEGLVLLEQGRTAEAGARFDRALELDADDAHAWLASGRLQAAIGEIDEALQRFRRATARDPDLADAYVEAALLLAAAGRSDEAGERWAALLRERPYDVGAAVALAKLRLEGGQSDARTLELARRAVRFGGGEVARRLLAKVHTARGEKKRAREILERLEQSAATEASSSSSEPEPDQPAGGSGS